MKISSILSSLIAGLFLSACSTLPPTLGTMSEAYSKALEEHERNNIFINILRASHDLPMHFTTIQTLQGTGLLKSTSGLTGKLYGQLFDNAALNITLESSRGFSFSLAALDNEKFIKSFVSDISIENFNIFSTSDQIDNRLTYSLLVADIRINPGSTGQIQYKNLPNALDYQAFQSELKELLGAGLQTETATNQTPLGMPLTRAEAINFYSAKANAVDDSLKMVQVGPADDPKYQPTLTSKNSRFCLAAATAGDYTSASLGTSIECSGKRLKAQATKSARDQLALNLRSSRDVFRYLGQISEAQTRDQSPWSATLQSGAGTPSSSAEALLLVKKGPVPLGLKTIAAAEYFGTMYYVPLENSGNSAKVFEFLSLLLSISKVSGSIPASPGIILQ